MVKSAFARFAFVTRSLAALLLLIAGQSAMPSFAAVPEGAPPANPGQWFVGVITANNNKAFCIPGTTRLVDVALAVAQYTQEHQEAGQLTPPLAIQILAQLYPCNGASTAENAGAPKADDKVAAPKANDKVAAAKADDKAAAPKADDAAAPVGLQTIDVLRALQNTSGHENDGVLDIIKKHSDAYPPPVLMGLSRVLFRQGDVDGAIFWFNAGRLRGNFDAWRSADVVSGRATMVALSRQLPIELRKAQFGDLSKLRAIIAKVIAWDETTPRNYDRRWIDFHGVVANQAAPGDGKRSVTPATIPPEKWDDLARQVREEYRKDLEKSIAMLGNAKLAPAH